MHAILLVGGKGTRLGRYTEHRPKALVELGGYSMLEIILRQLRAAGFVRVTLCISHLGHMIRDEFGDGRELGLALDYATDESPLGTAAPLLLVPGWTGPAVVMNGDLLTTIDFAGLLRAHRESGSPLTVATQCRRQESSVGLLRVHGDRITAVWEKPVVEWNISAGIYVADPVVRKYIPLGTPADMPGLITALIEHGEQVRGHPFSGAWHDIGTPGDYELALAEFCEDPGRYLAPRGPDGPSPGDPGPADAIDTGDGRARLDVSSLGGRSLATPGPRVLARDRLAEAVLVAFGSYQRGISGAERMAWRTVEWLRRQGRSVVVLTDSAPPSIMDVAGVPVVGSPAEMASARPGFRPALVHAFDLAKPEPVAAAAQLAAAYHAPLALTPASAQDVWQDPALGRAVCRQADVVFALTSMEAEQFRGMGVPPERVRLVPHASDLAGTADPGRFRRLHAISGPSVLFMGRRTALKGYQVVLQATRLVWRHRPETEFVFIGPDSDADATAVFAAHGDRRVHDLRVVDEQTKHDAIAACAVLCLPSSADVFPLVFVEAWSCGKPVISGDFAGAGNVVRDGVDGLVVPPAPGPVAEALVSLLADDTRRAAMGRAGQSRARAEFGWHRVAAAYEAGYAWAMRARSGTAAG